MRIFFYRVYIDIVGGPDKGKRMTAKCRVTAESSSAAKKKIKEFLKEESTAPRVVDGKELSWVEWQHAKKHWNQMRLVDLSLLPAETEGWPLGKSIYWREWDEWEAPESKAEAALDEAIEEEEK